MHHTDPQKRGDRIHFLVGVDGGDRDDTYLVVSFSVPLRP